MLITEELQISKYKWLGTVKVLEDSKSVVSYLDVIVNLEFIKL